MFDFLTGLPGALGTLVSGFGAPSSDPAASQFSWGQGQGETYPAQASWLDPVSDLFKQGLESFNPAAAPAAAEANADPYASVRGPNGEIYTDDWGTGEATKGGPLQSDPYSWRRIMDSVNKIGTTMGKTGLSLNTTGQYGGPAASIIAAPSVRALEAIPAEFVMPLMQAAMAGKTQRKGIV
jgi:hypothetical protein